MKFEIDPPSAEEIEITLFGGGVGECILIHAGKGIWYIVDSFLNKTTGNPIALDYLTHLGVDYKTQVKLIAATHWHDDHVKGISRILEDCENSCFVGSMATNKEEFLSVVAKDEAETANLKAMPSGISEFYACFNLLAKKPQVRRRVWAIQDRDLPKEGFLTEFYALSPSDTEISKAVSEFRFGSERK